MKRISLFLAVLCTGVFALLTNGCHDGSGSGSKPAIIPETHFGAIPSVPSVAGPIKAAATQATATEGTAAQSRLQAEGITKENFDTVKPVLVELTARVHEGVRTVLAYLFVAQEKANANDLAVLELKNRLAETEKLVNDREKAMQAMADTHNTENIEYQKRIKKLEDKLTQTQSAMARWIFGTACGLGMLATIAGGFIAFTVIPRTFGLAVSAFGIMTVMLGTAGLYYGQQIAIGGLVLGVVVMLGGVWGVVHYLKQDGASIAQGLQQAILAGKVKLADIKDHMDMAQTKGAKLLVDQETK